MKNVTKFCILTGTFLFFLTPLNAATNFCLEEDGFIYPLISKNDCDSSNDEKLELEEYRFIRDFENKDRYQKLLTYREDLLKKKQEVDTEQTKVTEKPKISEEEKINIQKEAIKRYGAEKNVKLKKLMEKRKKELADKRAKQKELMEERKKQRTRVRKQV